MFELSEVSDTATAIIKQYLSTDQFLSILKIIAFQSLRLCFKIVGLWFVQIFFVLV
jgi:hypothetical protein